MIDTVSKNYVKKTCRARNDLKKGLISYPYENEVHLQLCYPPAYAAPDAIAKWNWAKVVKTLRGMFTYPASRPEVQRTGEILVIQWRGVVTQGQLSLTKTFW